MSVTTEGGLEREVAEQTRSPTNSCTECTPSLNIFVLIISSTDKTIPLGMEAEGYTNPLYKTSVASNAVYDVPKGCSSSGEDEVDVITPRRPPIDPRFAKLRHRIKQDSMFYSMSLLVAKRMFDMFHVQGRNLIRSIFSIQYIVLQIQAYKLLIAVRTIYLTTLYKDDATKCKTL